MYDDEEQHPLIDTAYARQNPIECAKYLMTVFVRCLHEYRGRTVQMVKSREIRKRYGVDSDAIRNLCTKHGVLHEIHVEANESGNVRTVLYIDEIGFAEAMQNNQFNKPPDGWLSLSEIAAQWREMGIYTSVPALRTFCQRQAVQDARIAKIALIKTVNGRRRTGWSVHPEELLKLWKKETDNE